MDRAQEAAEKIREMELAHLPRISAAISLTHCEECEEAISEARRKAVPGCRRCRDCQQALEMTLENWRPL
jgi:phage/conjugal plasmid C-4 type zinc finger TraR family protein